MRRPTLFSPAAERNREPIAKVLSQFLPATGKVLEIASGTGQHAVYFAGLFPHLEWQPSDLDDDALASIEAYVAATAAKNILPPLRLDVTNPKWPLTEAAAIFSANMIHISPWQATEGLLRGASQILATGAPLILYGPYLIEGRETAPSNLAFDESLRSRNPRWGIRELTKVKEEAGRFGLSFVETIDMPANNFLVVFTKD